MLARKSQEAERENEWLAESCTGPERASRVDYMPASKVPTATWPSAPEKCVEFLWVNGQIGQSSCVYSRTAFVRRGTSRCAERRAVSSTREATDCPRLVCNGRLQWCHAENDAAVHARAQTDRQTEATVHQHRSSRSSSSPRDIPTCARGKPARRRSWPTPLGLDCTNEPHAKCKSSCAGYSLARVHYCRVCRERVSETRSLGPVAPFAPHESSL